MTTLSPHVLLTRAIFGLGTDRSSQTMRASRAMGEAKHLLAQISSHRLSGSGSPAGSLHGATVVLLTGPSGAGKSTLLSAIRTLLIDRKPLAILNMSRRMVAGHVATPALIDEIATGTGLSWHRIAHTLARVGLGQPDLWLRPMHTLSDGERSRALLALHILRGGQLTPTPVVLIDEFLSVLDRQTARSALSGTLRLMEEYPGALLVGATAHPDLVGMLAPRLTRGVRLGECDGTVVHIQASG